MLGGQRQKFSTIQKGKIPPLVIDYLLQEGEFDPRSSKKVHFASVVAKNAGQQGDEHQPIARHQQQAAASLDGPLPSLAGGGEGGPFFNDGIDIKASDTPTSSKSLSPLPSFSFTTSSPLILHQSQLISPSQRHVNRIWRAGDNLQLMLRVLVEFDDGSEKELKILVGTGAEANVIRKGLVDSHLIFPARNPVNFITANGQRLDGG